MDAQIFVHGAQYTVQWFLKHTDHQIIFTGNLSFFEKVELGCAKRNIAEIEKMLKALNKILENRHLNP